MFVIVPLQIYSINFRKRKEELVMENINSQRGLELISLQLLCVSAQNIISTGISKEMNPMKKEIILDLKDFFDTILNGFEFIMEKEEDKFSTATNPYSSIKIERAYKSISRILPENIEEGKKIIEDNKATCSEIIGGKSSQESLDKLYSFCDKIVNYLDSCLEGEIYIAS